MSLKSGILLVLFLGIFLPLFLIFGRRGDFTVVLCPTAVDHHYLFLLDEVVETWQDITASSWNPSSPLLTASSEDGLALASLWSSPLISRLFFTENLRLDRDLGMNKPAAGWKDARGWGGKTFLRLHLTWKWGCWTGTVPEQSESRGRITFIQLLSVFPRQNSHQRCQMHSDFPPCTLGIAIKRRDWAPSPYARRDSRKSKNCRYLLGV